MDREGTVLLYAVICSRKLTKLFALGNGKEMLPVQRPFSPNMVFERLMPISFCRRCLCARKSLEDQKDGDQILLKNVATNSVSLKRFKSTVEHFLKVVEIHLT